MGTLLKMAVENSVIAIRNNPIKRDQKILNSIKVIEFVPHNSDNDNIILYLHGGCLLYTSDAAEE